MATINWAYANQYAGNAEIVLWETVTTGDVGNALTLEGRTEVSVQMIGTIGTSTAVLQGSLDGGTTWHTLKDAFGSDISFSALTQTLVPIGPGAALIRPSVTGGSGADVDVYVWARRL